MAEDIKLPEQTRERLIEAGELVGGLKTLINKLRAAGRDTTLQEQRLASAEQKLRQIKTAFYPGETL